MVSFKLILTSALALSAPVLAALSPAQVIESTNLLSTKCHGLQVPAGQITVTNVLMGLLGQGPIFKVINGLKELSASVNALTKQVQLMPPCANSIESDAVLKAFSTFCAVHQVLLETLEDKAGLLGSVLSLVGSLIDALRQDKRSLQIFGAAILGITDNTSDTTDEQRQLITLQIAFDVTIKACNN